MKTASCVKVSGTLCWLKPKVVQHRELCTSGTPILGQADANDDLKTSTHIVQLVWVSPLHIRKEEELRTLSLDVTIELLL